MIIGITGTLGAGKGTVAEYLTKKHNFIYFSVRNFLAAEVLKQGKMVNRNTIATVALQLFKEHGPTYAIEQLMAQAPEGKNVVIESIRSIEEARYLKLHGALLWAIDADIKVRYQRTLQKDSSVENISFETFAEKEKGEVGLKEVISTADTVLHNESTKEALFAAVESALAKSGYTN